MLNSEVSIVFLSSYCEGLFHQTDESFCFSFDQFGERRLGVADYRMFGGVGIEGFSILLYTIFSCK